MHSKALELEHMTFENERLQADLTKMEKVPVKLFWNLQFLNIHCNLFKYRCTLGTERKTEKGKNVLSSFPRITEKVNGTIVTGRSKKESPLVFKLVYGVMIIGS